MHGLFDIHCHLIPYVDDGARNMEEAVRMLKMEYSQGVRYIIVTPHYRKGMFETPMEKILEQFLQLRELGKKIGVQLFLGCEYHVEEDMVGSLRAKNVPAWPAPAMCSRSLDMVRIFIPCMRVWILF